jgi:hypothetical protein
MDAFGPGISALKHPSGSKNVLLGISADVPTRTLLIHGRALRCIGIFYPLPTILPSLSRGPLLKSDRCLLRWHPWVSGSPPCQNTCRSNRINEPGAMMRKRIGKIRTSIQGQSGCAVAAAGERGVGRRCT